MEAEADDKRAFRSVVPLLLAIVPGLGFGLFLQAWGGAPFGLPLPGEAGLLLGLVAGTLWTWWEGRGDRRQLKSILLDRKLLRMWMILAGVFAFKGVIETSGAAEAVGIALLQMQVPLFWVAVSLPMIVGAISGITIAFVGASFPMLVTLIQAAATPELRLPFVVLAFASGFTGTLMTPLHLCLVLSNEYFGAAWPGVYSRLWLPVAILLGGAVAYFVLLKEILV